MNPASEFSQVMPPLSDSDHRRGSLSANIILMKYGDYQCSQSAQAHRTISAMQQQLGEQLCFIFRHFPQAQHPQAYRAAESAEAAAAQGKFWEMHRVLFEHQHALQDAELVQYAAQLQLNVPQFLRELAAHTHSARVQEDIDSGRANGVTETPTFFIGIRHQGMQNLEALLLTLLQVSNS